MIATTKIDEYELAVKMAELGATAEQLIRSVVKRSDLSLAEWNVLHGIVAAGRPLTIGEALDSAPLPTDPRRIDDLVGKGYVTKEPHPEEHRARIVEPTTRGRSLHETLKERIREEAGQAFSQLSDRQREALISAIGL